MLAQKYPGAERVLTMAVYLPDQSRRPRLLSETTEQSRSFALGQRSQRSARQLPAHRRSVVGVLDYNGRVLKFPVGRVGVPVVTVVAVGVILALMRAVRVLRVSSIYSILVCFPYFLDSPYLGLDEDPEFP